MMVGVSSWGFAMNRTHGRTRRHRSGPRWPRASRARKEGGRRRRAVAREAHPALERAGACLHRRAGRSGGAHLTPEGRARRHLCADVCAGAPGRRPLALRRRAPPRARRAPRRADGPAARRVLHAPRSRSSTSADPSSPSSASTPMAGTGDPGPRRDIIVIPGGTEMRVVLETGLSSETSHDGDRVIARVERATAQDGSVVLPGGTVLRGRVTDADRRGPRQRAARASPWTSTASSSAASSTGSTPPRSTVEGPDDTRRDVAVIGGQHRRRARSSAAS